MAVVPSRLLRNNCHRCDSYYPSTPVIRNFHYYYCSIFNLFSLKSFNVIEYNIIYLFYSTIIIIYFMIIIIFFDHWFTWKRGIKKRHNIKQPLNTKMSFKMTNSWKHLKLRLYLLPINKITPISNNHDKNNNILQSNKIIIIQFQTYFYYKVVYIQSNIILDFKLF